MYFSIIVSPKDLYSTPNVQSLNTNQRKCKFSDETDDSEIFSTYSQNGCLFECILKQAQEECDCIPWNFPSQQNESFICDLSGSGCFWNVLYNGSRILNCDCFVDCSKIYYNFNFEKRKLKAAELRKNTTESNILREYVCKYQVLFEKTLINKCQHLILLTIVCTLFTNSNRLAWTSHHLPSKVRSKYLVIVCHVKIKHYSKISLVLTL